MNHPVMRAMGAISALVLISIAAACSQQDDSSETKIIGGRIADYQPFMIRMSKQDADQKKGFCGGSWIAEGVILTAAHCVDDMEDLAKVSVSITRESDISTTNSVKVKAIVAHPDFDPSVMHNDVALLFVEPLNHDRLAKPVLPIPLNTDRDLPENMGSVTVFGWGNESSYGRVFGDELRQVDVPVVGLDLCRTAGDGYDKISDNEICAGDFDNGAIDSCQGDSGGPLIATKDGNPVLVGVVSWGIDCAGKKKPGVYARVSSYTDWIYRQIGAFNAPVFADNNSIAASVSQHCYTGFKSSEFPYQDNTGFEVMTRFDLGTDFQRQLTGVASQQASSVVSCTFARLGLGNVAVTIPTSNAEGKSDIIATVTIPDLQQAWTTEAKAELAIVTPCTNADGDSFLLEYSQVGSQWLKAEDTWFFINDKVENPDLAGYSAKSCTTHGTTVTLWKKTADDTGSTKYYTSVISSELNVGLTYHELFASSSSSSNTLTADLKFQPDSETKGTLSVVNETGDDVHTWVLECPLEFYLRDIYGVEYAPLLRSDLWVHKFVTPVSKHGIIPGNNRIDFSIDFKLAFNRSQFESCTINGRKLPLIVSANSQ